MKSTRLDQQVRSVKIIKILQKATKGMVEPAASQIVQQFGKNPFLILISCILSLRTKDTVSLPASIRLFKVAQTPEALANVDPAAIETLIYPVGFYRRKAITIHNICKQLIEQYQSKVPASFDGLIQLPGVGPKTANLVLGIGFDIPALCVDTHVHRISNRLGLVATRTVEETEAALQQVIPQEYWVEYNRLLVIWGQNICVPQSPFCSRCAIAPLCPRIGVTKHR